MSSLIEEHIPFEVRYDARANAFHGSVGLLHESSITVAKD
jgi:hypothetical protein